MAIKFTATPLLPPSMTLADGIKLIEKLPTKTTRMQARHSEAISAFRRVAQLAGRTPEDVLATREAINKLLDGMNPVLANLSPGGFYNLKSRVRRGLRLLGVIEKSGAKKVKLTAAWQAIVDALPEGPRIKIGRFSKFCSHNAIEPAAVSEAIFLQFRAEVEAMAVGKDAMKATKAAATAWNYGRLHVQGWPAIELVVPSNANPAFLLPMSAFPEGLQLDLEIWLKRVRDADEGDLHAPTKPFRPATIKARIFDCRYTASALVKVGMQPAEIVNLAILLKPANIDKVIAFIADRLGTQNAPTKIRVLAALLGLAKFGPPNCRKYTEALKGRLKTAVSQSGRKLVTMTEKNRHRVAAFKDPATVRRLLNLPIVLMKKADAVEVPTAETARQATIALAVEILLANPMRAANLYTLDLERHFQNIGQGNTSQVFVHIDGKEVKNYRDIDFQLPKSAKALLFHFVKRYRPLLLKAHGQPTGTCYLFPGTLNGHLDHKHAWQLLGNATEKQVGVRLSTHHFRHVTAYLCLSQMPGAYELVAKALGHADATTTKRFYTGAEHMSAIDCFQKVLRAAGAFDGPATKAKKKGQ
jgi:site-specific recombinase XerD